MEQNAPATLGRCALWAHIKQHQDGCQCPYCRDWAARWDRVAADTSPEVAT